MNTTYIVLYVATIAIFYAGYIFQKVYFRRFYNETSVVEKDKESVTEILTLILVSLIPVVNLIFLILIIMGSFHNVKSGKIFKNKKGAEYQYIFTKDAKFHIYHNQVDFNNDELPPLEDFEFDKHFR